MRSPVGVRQQLPGQTAKTSELCMWPSGGQRARWTRSPDKLPGGPEVGSRSEHWMDLFLSHGRLPVVPHFLTWGDFHALSRFARSTILEDKWGTTRNQEPIVIYNHVA